MKVCRVCLAVDVKMYDMKNYKLSEMFQNITGISACDEKESIHRVCWECAARLTAAAAFRKKALLSHALLKDIIHMNKSDIATLKQIYHSTLKSPLTIRTVFISSDIDCGDTIAENKEMLSDEIDANESKTELKLNKEEEEGTDLEEEEPLIDVLIKTEVESDPIDENNFNIKIEDVKSGAFSEITHFDDSFTSPLDDCEDEVKNTEEQISNNDEVLSEVAKIANAPKMDLVEDALENNSKLDVIGTTMDVSSSEEDMQSLAEVAAANKAKIKMTRKVGGKRLSDKEKQKIIALKKKGISITEIAKETGKTEICVSTWWKRYIKEDSDIEDDNTEQNDYHKYDPAVAGKRFVACSETVRCRLRKAGLEHILLKIPVGVNTERKVSEFQMKLDTLRQQIIRLKQEGVSDSETAYLLETTRASVAKWWKRWCNEGNLNNAKQRKYKRKTTSEEDQIIVDRVARGQSVHTASLAKEFGISAASCRRRLVEAGFKTQRIEKYDSDLKQRIMIMKQNGVSVADIMKQFRVGRNTIYIWWRQWCRENNLNTSEENTKTAPKRKQSSAEDATNEKRKRH